MKKQSFARALAVAAAMAVGASAFAQMTINGYYRVGGADNIAPSGAAAAALFDRIRLNLSWAAPDDMTGFKARLEADSTSTAGATPSSGLVNLFLDSVSSVATTTVSGSAYTTKVTNTVTAPSVLKYGYGYAKFLDGTIKLSAGKLDVTDYMAGQSIGNIYLGKVTTDEYKAKTSLLGAQLGTTTGAMLQVWPVEGLSVGLAMKADAAAIGAHNFGLDAYYLVPGLGKAILASQLYDDSDLSKALATVGFSYTGFKGLTATAALRYYSNGTPAYGAIGIVEYSQGPLFADVAGDYDISNSHVYVEGEVSYLVIPQLKVRAYGAYTDKVGTQDNSAININNGAMVSATKTTNQYLAGGDLVFPIGKNELMAGVAYGDVGGWQIPLLVKVNF